MTIYPTTYIDNFGKEDSSFSSDGTSLEIHIRNQIFVGQNFDSLELQVRDTETNFNFSFNEYNSLTDCSFQIEIPLKVRRNSEILSAILNIEITLENSKHPTTKIFELTVGNDSFDLQNGKESGMWFESQMIQLQKLLPQNTKINSCIFCAYSDYWVSGSDSFGTLLCFKDIKDKIVKVKYKSEYMDAAEKNGELTQETFWCEEFMDIGEDQWQYKDPT
jgi:hypothetical protein